MGTGADVRMGGAYVEAYLKDSSLRTGLKNVQQMLTSFGRDISSWGLAIAGIGASIRAPLELAARSFADMGVDLLKLSRETKYSVEALSEMKYAAEQSGLSLKEVIDQVQSGTWGFRALRQEAAQLGLTMKTADAVAAAELARALSSLHAVLKMIAVQVGAAVAPVIQETTLRLRKWAAVALEWVKNHKPLFALLARISSVLIIAGTGLTFFGGAISAAGTALGVLGSVLSFVVSPLGLTIAAIGAAGYAFFQFTLAGQATLAWIREQLPALKAIVTATFGGIHDALMAGDLLLAVKVLWAGIKTVWYQGLEDLNKVWMGTFRILGGIAIRAAFDVANALNGAIVIVEEQWVEFSTFAIDLMDRIAVGIATTFMRNFAYLLNDLYFLWDNKWGLLAMAAESILTTVGSTIKSVLSAAFLWVADLAIEALTQAIVLPLKGLAAIPGMAATSANAIAATLSAANQFQAGLRAKSYNVETEPSESLQGKLLKKSSEMDAELKRRQEERAMDKEQGLRGANVAGSDRGHDLDALQSKMEKWLRTINPAFANDGDLEQSQKELADLIAEAQAKRLESEKTRDAAGLGAPPAVIAAGIGATVQAATKAMGGTFNPFAAQGIGAGPLTKIEKHTKQIAENTKQREDRRAEELERQGGGFM